jgi:hypothetical protein
MIARNHDDLDAGPQQVEPRNEFIERALSGRRRVRHVEHVSRHQQRVDRTLLNDTAKPVEKLLVFEHSLSIAKHLTQMPVRGVQQAQHEVLDPVPYFEEARPVCTKR